MSPEEMLETLARMRAVLEEVESHIRSGNLYRAARNSEALEVWGRRVHRALQGDEQ